MGRRRLVGYVAGLSILATFGGILLLSAPSDGVRIRIPGVLLAIGVAVCVAAVVFLILKPGKKA